MSVLDDDLEKFGMEDDSFDWGDGGLYANGEYLDSWELSRMITDYND